MNSQIIKLRFLKDGKPHGMNYSYYSRDALSIGDIVKVNEQAKGIVTDIGRRKRLRDSRTK